MLISPFDTNVNNNNYQLTGGRIHKRVEKCGWFLTCMNVFYFMHMDAGEHFNFYLNEEEDPNSKNAIKLSYCQKLFF